MGLSSSLAHSSHLQSWEKTGRGSSWGKLETGWCPFYGLTGARPRLRRCPDATKEPGCNSPVRGCPDPPSTQVLVAWLRPSQEAAKLRHKPRAQAPELLLAACPLAIPPWRNSLRSKDGGSGPASS